MSDDDAPNPESGREAGFAVDEEVRSPRRASPPVRARPSRPAAAAFRADSPARVVPAPRLLPVPRPVVRRPSSPPG